MLQITPETIRPVVLLGAALLGAGAMSYVRYRNKAAHNDAVRYSPRKAAWYYVGGVLAFGYVLAIEWSGLHEAVELVDPRVMALALPSITDEIVDAIEAGAERADELQDLDPLQRAIMALHVAITNLDREELDRSTQEYHDQLEAESDRGGKDGPAPEGEESVVLDGP